MLDIKYIRENQKKVQTACDSKNVKVDISELLQLDDKRKRLIKQLDDLRAQLKQTKAPTETERDQLKTIKNEIEALSRKFEIPAKEYEKLLAKVPNVYSDDTPIGKDESGNKVVKTVGEKPEFDFEPQSHWQLGESLGLLDKERAVKISGSRFVYHVGSLVMLEQALINFVLNLLTDQEKLHKIIQEAGLNVPDTLFIPITPPEIINRDVMGKMARLEPAEDKYHLRDDDQVLIGSAEHSLGPMFMNEILEVEKLPLRYIGISSAFRREAGTYGKDTHGLIRLHQFKKLEMESFAATLDQSLEEQSFFVALQEYIMQTLKLPYRVVAICTGDMGAPDFRQIDIETWFPAEGKYRETHTSDNVTDYQARRLNIRYRDASNNKQLVQMNDATAAATGRMMAAIMENYQTKEGDVRIPQALRPYMGNKEVL